MEAFQAKMVAAATGSTLTALTMTPFDVVKTRLQTQPPKPAAQPLFPRPPANVCCQPAGASVGCVRQMSSLSVRALSSDLVCIWDGVGYRTERVNGFADAVQHVWRAEGIRGLWKGTGTTLAIGVPSSTFYMLTYDHLLNKIVPTFCPSPALVPLLSGVIARTTITSLASPLELIRTNLQSTPLSPDQPHTLRSVLATVRELVRANGVRHLWRGLGPTLWRDVPFSGMYWASYEAWKHALARRRFEGAPAAFVSGAVSGITAALITSPFDVLKTRRQAVVMAGTTSGATSRTLPLLMEIVRNEGWRALFAGIGPRMVKIAPACGIMIACYEGIGKALTIKDTPSRE